MFGKEKKCKIFRFGPTKLLINVDFGVRLAVPHREAAVPSLGRQQVQIVQIRQHLEVGMARPVHHVGLPEVEELHVELAAPPGVLVVRPAHKHVIILDVPVLDRPAWVHGVAVRPPELFECVPYRRHQPAPRGDVVPQLRHHRRGRHVMAVRVGAPDPVHEDVEERPGAAPGRDHAVLVDTRCKVPVGSDPLGGHLHERLDEVLEHGVRVPHPRVVRREVGHPRHGARPQQTLYRVRVAHPHVPVVPRVRLDHLQDAVVPHREDLPERAAFAPPVHEPDVPLVAQEVPEPDHVDPVLVVERQRFLAARRRGVQGQIQFAFHIHRVLYYRLLYLWHLPHRG